MGAEVVNERWDSVCKAELFMSLSNYRNGLKCYSSVHTHPNFGKIMDRDEEKMFCKTQHYPRKKASVFKMFSFEMTCPVLR